MAPPATAETEQTDTESPERGSPEGVITEAMEIVRKQGEQNESDRREPTERPAPDESGGDERPEERAEDRAAPKREESEREAAEFDATLLKRATDAGVDTDRLSQMDPAAAELLVTTLEAERGRKATQEAQPKPGAEQAPQRKPEEKAPAPTGLDDLPAYEDYAVELPEEWGGDLAPHLKGIVQHFGKNLQMTKAVIGKLNAMVEGLGQRMFLDTMDRFFADLSPEHEQLFGKGRTAGITETIHQQNRLKVREAAQQIARGMNAETAQATPDEEFLRRAMHMVFYGDLKRLAKGEILHKVREQKGRMGARSSHREARGGLSPKEKAEKTVGAMLTEWGER